MSRDLRGERVLDLRHLLRMSQGELASSIDINSTYISKIENGVREFTLDLALRISLRHKVPLTFFNAEDPIPNAAPPTFRKKATTSMEDVRYVETLQKLAMRLFHHTSIESGYVPWRNPVPDGLSDPEEAASLARRYFGLGESEAVRNVTRLIERNGAGVITSLAPDADEKLSRAFHGVSRPNQSDDRPVIALFSTKRGDVTRLTLAHELAHIVLDRTSSDLSPREREARAFRFAGAFLFPAEVARDWITPDLPLSGYLAIKSQYGISASAAIRRGKDLELIDAERYRSLMIQHSSRGWRTNEPGRVEPETPALFAQAISRAWPSQTLKSAANAAGVPSHLIDHWLGDTVPAPLPDSSSPVIDFSAERARRASG